MLKKYEDILKKLNITLDRFEIEIEDILRKSEQGIKITKLALKQLKVLVVNQGFKNQTTEIHFFKRVKPKVYSKLIYYVKLFNIESKRPRSSNKSQVKYLNKHIDKLQVYFNDNLEFYHYYRRGASFLDEQYFLRGKADIHLCSNTFQGFIDEQFSTSHDSTVA
ncbi:MAG: RteC domain-containing protein, partial [Oleispira sp.]|nr:RteC domain-containing protein [Oleispira sp.]